MNISIFGYKINLEILILIGIIYLILIGHTFCGCLNHGIMEGFADGSYNLFDFSGNDVSGNDVSGNQILKAHMLKTQLSAGSNINNNVPLAKGSLFQKSKTQPLQEGFVGANTNYGQSSPYDLSGDTTINTNSWSAPNMNVIPGQPLNSQVKDIINRPNGPLPLPEGEMLLFADTPFKPECCPNTYSNSSGCACMNTNTYNYLILRGGNNVPYSEY